MTRRVPTRGPRERWQCPERSVPHSPVLCFTWKGVVEWPPLEGEATVWLHGALGSCPGGEAWTDCSWLSHQGHRRLEPGMSWLQQHTKIVQWGACSTHGSTRMHTHTHVCTRCECTHMHHMHTTHLSACGSWIFKVTINSLQGIGWGVSG